MNPNKLEPSFPRRRESSLAEFLDSRLRGNDDIGAGMTKDFFEL